MSYLNVPRLHFAGKFQADPSTVNNYPGNFDSDQFQADYSQLAGDWGDSWNPKGTGSWRFEQCVVMSVVYMDGTVVNDPSEDPIIGMSIVNTNTKVAGKIVDLDSQQQMVSEIWGFQLSLVGVAGTFTGDFHAAAFADAWVRRSGPPVNANFGAFYQSTLNLIKWIDAGNSRFLRELASRYMSGAPNRLSIKFNVDGHNSDNTTPDFTFGRVVGTIGVYEPDEPIHFLRGRLLSNQNSILNTAYCLVKNDVLHVDLGNSLPTKTPGGAFVDLGTVSIKINVQGKDVVDIAEINYNDPKWYIETAGIVSLKVQSEQLKLIASNPLILTTTANNSETKIVLAEDPQGIFIRPDQFVFRMNPGDQTSAMFHALKFGMPASNENITLIQDTTFMTGNPFPLGTPESAFKIAEQIKTNENGIAELTMGASDPGNPRKFMDGQLYGVGYQLGDTPPQPGNTAIPINVIVYSGYKIPDEPNWMEHVQPILSQYAILYPVMKPIVDLDNFSSVLQKSYILKNVFNMSIENPNYMPVTRDLSEAKREMIRKWLDNPVYMNLDSAEDLTQALQQAIELEHSTIPPYLTALYTIKPNLNTEVASLIRSIVLEEMLHMALVANLLISIGGSPQIGRRKFVPVYPSSLPGGLRFGLTVRLRKCSIEHIRECFMAIEEPEDLINIKRNQLTPESLRANNKYTIGWFYDEVVLALERLSADGKIAFGNDKKQVSEWSGTGSLFTISSLEDAKRAIQEIKDQGEGTSKNPQDLDHELAHYFKFAEIVEGRHLVREDGRYSYTGAPIAFETDSVWPMVDDPNAAMYPKDSRASILNHQFNETYRALLGALQQTFNGNPSYIKDAIGVMFSLETIALQLVKTPSGLNDGTTAGPSFEI